jgi:hypothetical protein
MLAIEPSLSVTSFAPRLSMETHARVEHFVPAAGRECHLAARRVEMRGTKVCGRTDTHASFVRAAITLIAYEFRERERCLQCIAGLFLTHTIEKREVEQNKAANYTTGSLYCTGWRDMAMEHEPCLVWAGRGPGTGRRRVRT